MSAPSWARVLVVGALFLAVGPSASADPLQDLKRVDIIGYPVAPVPKDASSLPAKGTGLCAAFRLADPALAYNLFPPRPADYPGGTSVADFAQAVNNFMDPDQAIGGMKSGPYKYNTLRTPFDFAVPLVNPGQNADGDFILTPGCPTRAGCPFPASEMNLVTTMTPPFGSRYRGFLLVPTEWVAQDLHFGFISQNAVALRVFVKDDPKKPDLTVREIVSRAPQGAPQYRVSNTVKFKNPGLYPIEVLFANNAGYPAALEMVVELNQPSDARWMGDVDQQIPQGNPLSIYGFNLSYTQPDRFFQTKQGTLPYPGQPDTCLQCPRKWAGTPSPQPAGICPANYACNEAAVCAFCDVADYCGPNCEVCTGSSKPYCYTDPQQSTSVPHCVECVMDSQCPRGESCVSNQCKSYDNCCPDAPYSLPIDPTGANPNIRYCSACRTDSDCPAGKCDLPNGRCIAALPACNTNDRCGTDCINCITSTATDPQGARPHCMNGTVCVQCRSDFECSDGNYCRSGDCVPCTADRHCGPTCTSCGIKLSLGADNQTVKATTDKPFCVSPNGDAAGGTCVRCLTDAHCGTGGTCDPASHTCSPESMCTTDQADYKAGYICVGTAWMECLTSAQCPCGQCIAGVCTSTCGDSTDCRGNQCCAQDTAQCMDGRCKPGLTANGGALCCSATGGSVGVATDPVAPTPSRQPLWALLASLGLLAAWRLRSLRGAPKPESAQPGRE